MKVKELKDELIKLPLDMDDCEVMLSVDSEGNDYKLLYNIADDGYYNDKTGETYFEYHGYKGNGFKSEEDWLKFKNNNKKVVVFYPY